MGGPRPEAFRVEGCQIARRRSRKNPQASCLCISNADSDYGGMGATTPDRLEHFMQYPQRGDCPQEKPS